MTRTAITQSYLSTNEIAQRLGAKPRTIRDWIANGCPTPTGRIVLHAFRAGKSHRISLDDLELFELRLKRAGARRDLNLS